MVNVCYLTTNTSVCLKVSPLSREGRNRDPVLRNLKFQSTSCLKIQMKTGHLSVAMSLHSFDKKKVKVVFIYWQYQYRCLGGGNFG